MKTRKATAHVTFNLAQPGDAEVIGEMSKRLIEVDLPWSWKPRRVAWHIGNANSVVLTARVGGGIVGFAIMQFADETAHLNLLAVEPAYEQLGIGRGLMEWLEKTAATAGTFDIALEVREGNVGARWFYRKLGYREERCLTGYYSRVENAVRMVRDLRVAQKP